MGGEGLGRRYGRGGAMGGAMGGGGTREEVWEGRSNAEEENAYKTQ